MISINQPLYAPIGQPIILGDGFVHGIGGSGTPTLTFLAAYYSGTEFLLQVEGTGTPTSIHTSILLAPDHEGVYHEFGANKHVIWGGRFVDEDTVYATDSGGDLLDPLPLTVSQPDGLNSFHQCRDMTDAAWIVSNCTPTYDQVGIGGKPNTASKLTDAVGGGYVFDAITVPANSVLTLCRWVKKKTAVNHTIRIRDNINGANKNSYFNPETGVFVTTAANASEVVDRGDLWQVLTQYNDTGTNTSVLLYAYVTGGTLAGGVSNTIPGDSTYSHVSDHIGKTIAEAKNLLPIITSGAPAPTASLNPAWAIENFNNTALAFYAEVELDGSQRAFNCGLTWDASTLLYELEDTDSNTVNISGAGVDKIAFDIDSAEALMALAANGSDFTEGTYCGELFDLLNDFIFCPDLLFPGRVRCLRVYIGGTRESRMAELAECMKTFVVNESGFFILDDDGKYVTYP